MSDNRDGLDCILQAINNIVEPKVAKLKYDKTYRAKVTQQIDTGLYMVKINNVEYKLPYSGTLNVGDIVKVKAPLNNFSDIYIEALPGSGGGGGGGTTDYNDLTNKPVLNSNYSTSQTPNASEIIKGTISLHKISKTGNYNDLLNKPDLDFIPTSEKGKAGGVATLGTDSKITSTELPNNLVYDSNYVHTDNNFSNTYKDKLDSVQEGAQVNVIEKVQKNGVNLPITNKTVNITVPTKTSDLENDSGYVKNTDYATISTGGVVKVGSDSSVDYGFNLTDDGVLYARQKNYTNYLSVNNNYAISKGTLENVIANKTNTSVFPNNSGHIKSKYRIGTRGYTSGATWYYPLCKLPVVSNSNSSSATIRGRVGGWNDSNMSSLYAMMWNRVTTGITLLDLAGNLYQETQTIQDVWNLCDIVIYKNSDNSDTVYLKCNNYFCFDLDLELFQDSAQILYDGSYLTSEPSGTLSAQASTANERMELYNSALYVKGNKILTNSDIVDDLTSTSITNVLSANQGKVLDSKKIEADNIKAGDNITLSVDGKNITINSTGGGSGSEKVEIGDTEPTQDTIELWVDTSEQGTGSIGTEQIEYGNITAAQMTNASIGGQDGKIYELTFQNSYSTPPTVITNFYSEQGVSYYGFGATQVVALSNTKCTLCVFVQGLTGSKCGISYMVKGK